MVDYYKEEGYRSCKGDDEEDPYKISVSTFKISKAAAKKFAKVVDEECSKDDVEWYYEELYNSDPMEFFHGYSPSLDWDWVEPLVLRSENEILEELFRYLRDIAPFAKGRIEYVAQDSRTIIYPEMVRGIWDGEFYWEDPKYPDVIIEFKDGNALVKVKDWNIDKGRGFRKVKSATNNSRYSHYVPDEETLPKMHPVFKKQRSEVYAKAKANKKATEITSIGEVVVGNEYDRDELYALCDWFAQEPNVLFGSVCGSDCFRAEPVKDKWVVKEIWEREKKNGRS